MTQQKNKSADMQGIVPTNEHEAPLTQVSRILAAAMSAPNIGPDVVRLLVEAHERERAFRAHAEFAAALARFQAECPVIPKSSKAEFASMKGGRVSYSYAELDEIRSTIAPAMSRCGLSYRWRRAVESGVGEVVVCEIRHLGGHVDASSSFPVRESASSLMSPAQSYAAALTFGKRYALMDALGIVAGDIDHDEIQPGRPLTERELSNVVSLLDMFVDPERKELTAKILTRYAVASLEHVPSSAYVALVRRLKEKLAKSGA